MTELDKQLFDRLGTSVEFEALLCEKCIDQKMGLNPKNYHSLSCWVLEEDSLAGFLIEICNIVQ